MKCIKCLHEKTNITNSRISKKAPQVWRRRQCLRCHHIFTTYERIAMYEELTITKAKGDSCLYSPGVLFADIIRSLEHLPATKQATDAFWLLRTIEDKIARIPDTSLSSQKLTEITYTTLSLFDQSAGLQYAARHGLSHKYRRTKKATS